MSRLRGRRRLAAALVVAALSTAACTEPAGSNADRAAPSTGASPSASPSVVINPPGVLLDNAAFGASARRLRVAVRDLKKVDLWFPLTRHLYRIKFASRLGVVNIPDDGHLADAVLTAAFDDKAQGRMCDVMFFPNAIARDLERWSLYYQQGAISEPPPTLRQYWGAITAHELAHCFPGGPGEKVARAWEDKALERLQELSQ